MHLHLDITKKCNAKCIFCEIPDDCREDTRDLSLEDIKNKIDQVEDCKEISITGGEPAIHKNVLEVVSYAKEKGFKKITLETNGLILAYYDLIKNLKCAGLTHVQISFQTVNSKKYDEIINVNNSLDIIKKGMMNLVKLKIPFSSNTVVHSKNIENLEDTIKFLLKSGPKGIVVSSLNPCSNDKIAVSYSNAIRIISQVFANLTEDEKERISLLGFPECLLIKENSEFINYLIPNRLPDEVLEKYKILIEPCKKCDYQVDCGGPWKFYIEKFGVDEF